MGGRTNEDSENVLLLEEKDVNNKTEGKQRLCVRSFMEIISNFAGKLTKEKTDEDNKDQEQFSLLGTNINDKDLISNDERESLLER